MGMKRWRFVPLVLKRGIQTGEPNELFQIMTVHIVYEFLVRYRVRSEDTGNPGLYRNLGSIPEQVESVTMSTMIE